jgi:hypothetical protein
MRVLHLPGNRVAQHTPRGVSTHRQEVSGRMPPLRQFHSIAALRGNGLRPEPQALFERLAVEPHPELFVREDGMVQSGPADLCASAVPESRRDRHLPRGLHRAQVTRKNVSRQNEMLPCAHSLPVPNARVVHSVLHRNIPGFFTGLFHDVSMISPPEIHRLLHGVIHRFSTISPLVVDRLVLR